MKKQLLLILFFYVGIVDIRRLIVLIRTSVQINYNWCVIHSSPVCSCCSPCYSMNWVKGRDTSVQSALCNIYFNIRWLMFNFNR